MIEAGRVTPLLAELRNGNTRAWHDLAPLVYDEMRRIASRYLRKEREADLIIETPALVHEAFLRLVREQDRNFENRAHFYGACAQTMRRILVDAARRRNVARRAGRLDHAELDLIASTADIQPFDWIELDRALDELGQLNERHLRTVELRFFVGLTLEETADVLGVTVKTVQRDWVAARAWLWKELKG